MSPRSRKPEPGSKESPSVLPGLGPKSEQALHAAGITTVAQLRRMGSVQAYISVKKHWPGARLNLLWALEGAIAGVPWQVVAKEHRLSPLLALEAAQSDA